MIVHARSEHARGAAAARRLRQRARRFLAALGREEGELSILVVGDAAMRRLNRRWRGKDRPTDVLSFPAAGAGALLGDVVVSLDTAVRVARAARRPLASELDRYLAHGLLHLLGHDHERPTDAARMAAAEDALVGEGMVRGSRSRSESRSRSRRRLSLRCRSQRSVRAEPFDHGRFAACAQGERSVSESRRRCSPLP